MATVANIAMVSMVPSSVLPSLGTLFTDGLARNIPFGDPGWRNPQPAAGTGPRPAPYPSDEGTYAWQAAMVAEPPQSRKEGITRERRRTNLRLPMDGANW